jgi:DNA uptake protein ComE-like DNA-binding protein
MRERGSILVGVLWCVALLSLIVVGTLHTARRDVILAKHFGDDTQARYLALAGVEKAKALIALDARQSRTAARAYSPALEDAPADFREVTLGRGQFSVLHRDPSRPDGPWLHGVGDESARLNLNVAGTNELLRLPGLTLDIAAAILDWRDGDAAPGPGGAEVDYYASLTPPYLPRNGPFQTVRELLMVRGVTPELLTGRRPGGRRGGPPVPGWEESLTVHSSAPTTTVSGEERINLQTADEKALANVRGFSPEIAKAIVARRNGNKFENLLDLLDLTAAPANGAVGPDGTPLNVNRGGRGNPGNAGNPNGGGPKLITETTLIEAADQLTVEENDGPKGQVNVNTAPNSVLACLPGVELPLADAIVGYRRSAGPFTHPLGLLKVPGMNRELLKSLLPRLTARSNTYRILAEGTVPGRGNRRRLEVVVSLDGSTFSTLSYREDDL